MMKTYWPIPVSWLLCWLVPLVLLHTRFRGQLNTYAAGLIALDVLLFVAAVVVWRKRRKASR